MKFFKIIFIILIIGSFTNCASGYRTINPNTLNYRSSNEDKNVKLDYKYELLDKKYKKKQDAKGIKLIAVKITNNSNRNLTFGKNIKLVYEDGSPVYTMEKERVYTAVKQSSVSYLLYLLLTPTQLFRSETINGQVTETSSLPIGLVIGPALAGGNLFAASSANSKLQKDLSAYNLENVMIRSGETISGLIGIRSDDYSELSIKVN